MYIQGQSTGARLPFFFLPSVIYPRSIFFPALVIFAHIAAIEQSQKKGNVVVVVGSSLYVGRYSSLIRRLTSTEEEDRA